MQDNELGTAELEALVLAVYPPCLPSELRHFQVSSFCCCCRLNSATPDRASRTVHAASKDKPHAQVCRHEQIFLFQ